MTAEDPKRKNPISATGKTVAANVKRIREGQRLAFTELAAILDKLGKPIPTLGLRHIEAEKRRVDSDDLVALAAALNVSPVTLLMPDADEPTTEVPVTGQSDPIPAYVLWSWLVGEVRLDFRSSDDGDRGEERAESLLQQMYQRQVRPKWVPVTGVGRLRSIEGTDMARIDRIARNAAARAVQKELSRAANAKPNFADAVPADQPDEGTLDGDD